MGINPLMRSILLCLAAVLLCAGDARAEVQGAWGEVPDAAARRAVWVSGRLMIFEGGVLSEWGIPKQAVDDLVKVVLKESIASVRAGKPEKVYPKGERVKFMRVEYFEFVMGAGVRVQCFPDSVVIEDEEGMKDYRDKALFSKVRTWIKLGRIKGKEIREVPEAKIVPAKE